MNYRLTNPPKKKTVNFSVPTAGLNYNLVRPIGTIRNISDDPKPSIKMNSEFQERMRRIFNHGVDDDDNDDDDDEGEADMKDKSSNKGNGRTSISTATKCCDDPYQRKRKFPDGNVPSSSGATCSSSNLGRPVYSKQKFDEFRKDRDLSPEQIQRKNEAFIRLQKSQEILCDDILLDDNSSDESAASSHSEDSANKYKHFDLSKLSYCPTCNHTLKKKSKRSDKELHDSIMEMTLMDVVSNTCCGVNASSNSINAKRCRETNGKCIESVLMVAVAALRKDFWEDASVDDIITTKVRGNKLKAMVSKFYDASQSKFNYQVGGTSVCERGFLVLLGLISGKKNPGKQFERIKNEIMGKVSLKIVDKELRTKQDLRTSITNHAKNYIMWMAELNADSCPTDENKLMLPYDTVREFYEEYVAYNTAEFIPINKYAKRETFRLAFKSLGDKYKLIGAKGSFPTCDICNNANDLLRDTKIKDQSHREIIFRFKKLHLMQQMAEREHLEKNRLLAKNSQYLGQPTQAFFLIDAMTHSRGDTPQVGGTHRQSKNETSAVISNRVIGCEVVCGPVDEIFYYNTDNLVASGANTMCQVVLNLIEDLSKRLARYGKMLPRTLFAQFDNCGENKNKYMFGMFSHLIEEHYFDEIYCNFLLVGHTHCSIDQNFGVLTEKIKDQHFIGSPLSFQNLLDVAHKDPSKRPTVNRQISIVYDFVKYFTPMLNSDIHFIRIPHCFKFSRVMNKAVMRYKMFSTHKTWLPEPPEYSILNTEDDLFKSLITDIDFNKYVIIGGEGALNRNLGLDGVTITDALENSKFSSAYTQLRQVTPRLRELELTSIDQQQQRMIFEEQYGGTKNMSINFQSSSKTKKDIEDIMKNTSKDKRGYILYLKSKVGSEERQPQPVVSIEDVESLLRRYSADSDSDEEVNVEQVNQQKRKRVDKMQLLQSNIKIIVQTAKSVLNNLDKTHLYSSSTKPEFHYKAKRLSQQEIFFYRSRSTVENVLKIYLDTLKAESPFEWIKSDVLSEEALRSIELKKLETQENAEKVIKLANSLLMKPHHDKEDGEHVMTGVTGETKNRKNKAKANEKATVQGPTLCCITECNRIASETCSIESNICTMTGRILKCKGVGIRFCDMHGPMHTQHEYQSLKESNTEREETEERARVALERARARIEERKKKQKEEKVKRAQTIEAMERGVAKAVEARSILSKKTSEEKESVITKNRAILQMVNVIMEEAENNRIIDDSTDSPHQPEALTSDKSIEISTSVGSPAHEGSSNLCGNSLNPDNGLAISPQVYNNSKSRVRTKLLIPELAIELSDRRYNQQAHQCMINAFNGKNEPESCFLNTFNYVQFRTWLPDLLTMYNIPLLTVMTVFNFGPDDILDYDKCVNEMREGLRKPKIRTSYLKTIYTYLTT